MNLHERTPKCKSLRPIKAKCLLNPNFEVLSFSNATFIFIHLFKGKFTTDLNRTDSISSDQNCNNSNCCSRNQLLHSVQCTPKPDLISEAVSHSLWQLWAVQFQSEPFWWQDWYAFLEFAKSQDNWQFIELMAKSDWIIQISRIHRDQEAWPLDLHLLRRSDWILSSG